MLLNPADRLAEVSPLLEVERFAYGHQPFHGRGFEPNEHALASRTCGELKQFVIVGEVDGRLTDPRPGQPLPSHRSEEIFGVCEMIASRTDEIVVHKKDDLFPDHPQFSNDISDGSVAERSAVKGSDATKAAIQRTAARDCIHGADATLIHRAQGLVTASANTCPHTDSASPVTTASAWSSASSRQNVA